MSVEFLNIKETACLSRVARSQFASCLPLDNSPKPDLRRPASSLAEG